MNARAKLISGIVAATLGFALLFGFMALYKSQYPDIDGKSRVEFFHLFNFSCQSIFNYVNRTNETWCLIATTNL